MAIFKKKYYIKAMSHFRYVSTINKLSIENSTKKKEQKNR